MKIIKISVLAVLIAALILAICACDAGDGKGKYDFGEKGDVTVLSDLADYYVIRGDLCSDTEKEALVKLRDTVTKNLGITLKVSTDWIGVGQEEHEKEILIGDTEREASVAALEGLGYHDFVIRLDGSKLVIAGGSDVATMEAVDYFIANYIDIFRSTFSYPTGEGYRYVRTYTVDSFTIDGTDISEYRLYAPDPEVDLTDVQRALSDELAGVHIEIDEEKNDIRKYIIFDNSSLDVDSYSITLDEDGNLIVAGSMKTFETARSYFKKAFFEELAAVQGREPEFTELENVTKKLSVNEIYTKKELCAVLDSISADGSTAAGEVLHGSQSMPNYTVEIYREATGKSPAVIGVDLGERGLNLPELSSVDWSRAVCELTDFARAGGIISVTAGIANPSGAWELSGGKTSGTLGDEKAWEDLFSDGTELNIRLREELMYCAVFLRALSDNGVSVLWSPVCDRNAESCWFAPSVGNEEHTRKLWIYIHDLFDSLGIDNLIWVYTPSLTRDPSSALSAYPGNEYTDYIGGNVIIKSRSDFDTAGKTYAPLAEKTGKKSAIIRFSLLPGSTLIAETKDAQSAIFGSDALLSEVKKLSSKAGFSLFVTDYGASSLEWLGGGSEFVSDGFVLTLDDIAVNLSK